MTAARPVTRHLCLTICGYRNPSIPESKYYNHMIQKHAPLVKPFMEKYGILKYTMISIQTHNLAETKSLLHKISSPDMANTADYDCFVQIVFKDVDDFVRMESDPEYQNLVTPDHANFADTKRSKMTIGYLQDFSTDLKGIGV